MTRSAYVDMDADLQARAQERVQGRVNKTPEGCWEKALDDWDEAHRHPMKEFASALNTSLADARRRSKSQER